MKTRLVILSLAVLWPAAAAADVFSAFDAPRGQPGVDRAAPAEPRINRPVTAEPARPQPVQTARPGQGPRDVPGAPNPPSAPPAPAADDDSMRFELVREGPAERCGNRCRTWVSASGTITNDTPKAFESFMQGRDLRGAVVVLHSPGGSVGGGLELGNLIRRAGMNTTVGKTALLPATTGEPRGTLSADANCASMCTFVLLGGVRRAVPAEAKVLVHQIWPSAKRDDPTAQNYTAENIVGVQRSLGVMAKYTVEMGGDIELFEMSMRIPPWERMKQLTADELRRVKLHNVENIFDAPVAALTPVPSPVATPVAPTVSNLSPVPAFASPAPSNGWTLIEKPGLRGLARRHPITVEGEQIGNFEIMFACSASPENYTVRYVETRKASVSERLKSIVLSAGPTQIPMAIESSAARAPAHALETVANGTITAKLLSAYGEVRGRAIQVATESTGTTSTAIRLANTGLAPSLPQLAAVCRTA